jgi:hypothetical protein
MLLSHFAVPFSSMRSSFQEGTDFIFLVMISSSNGPSASVSIGQLYPECSSLMELTFHFNSSLMRQNELLHDGKS